MGRYEEAISNLCKGAADAQTLCVYRFQAPVLTMEHVCRAKPELFDLPITWTGSAPDARVTVTQKVMIQKGWLLQQRILLSDFIRDASPDDFGTTYETALRKARGLAM